MPSYKFKNLVTGDETEFSFKMSDAPSVGDVILVKCSLNGKKDVQNLGAASSLVDGYSDLMWVRIMERKMAIPVWNTRRSTL